MGERMLESRESLSSHGALTRAALSLTGGPKNSSQSHETHLRASSVIFSVLVRTAQNLRVEDAQNDQFTKIYTPSGKKKRVRR
jgi:hypothetical protein